MPADFSDRTLTDIFYHPYRVPQKTRGHRPVVDPVNATTPPTDLSPVGDFPALPLSPDPWDIDYFACGQLGDVLPEHGGPASTLPSNSTPTLQWEDDIGLGFLDIPS